MRHSIKLLFFYIFILMTNSCQKNKSIVNHFTSTNDTIRIKTKKIKGNGLFELGYTSIQFKDTSNSFLNAIKYPKNVDDIKRYQLKADLKETKNHIIELLLARKDGSQVFIVDENNNKDLTDDTIRKCEKIIWSSPPELVKCEYLISNGIEIIKDSSWLCIGNSHGKILLGKREHLIGEFTIDNEDYQVGVVEPRNIMSFNYGFQPEIALLSELGIKIDSIMYSDLLKFGEVLNLNNKYYRFENISNNGDMITLVKDENFRTKIGTQKGMIAPDFNAITVSGDTISSSILDNKLNVIANSCGCGGDKESTEAFYEMERLFGDLINVLHVDSNIKESNIGIHIDSEDEFNKDFYNKYRQEYCSRICYVIGKDKRIIDKFNINEWKNKLARIIK